MHTGLGVRFRLIRAVTSTRRTIPMSCVRFDTLTIPRAVQGLLLFLIPYLPTMSCIDVRRSGLNLLAPPGKGMPMCGRRQKVLRPDRDPTRLSRSGRPLEMTGSRSWPVRRVGWRTRSGETKFASHGVPGMHGKTAFRQRADRRLHARVH